MNTLAPRTPRAISPTHHAEHGKSHGTWALCFLLAAAFWLTGCETSPSPTRAPTAVETATPSMTTVAVATPSPLLASPTTVARATATPPAPTATPPLPSPTPRAIERTVRLGLLPWNSYDPQYAVLDRERGLAYVLALSGEAAPKGQSVLTVVDLAAGTLRASAPLAASLSPACTAALSADGTRLYIASGSGKNASLLVVSTGVSGGKLGDLLASRPGVLALALEPESGRLFTLDSTHLHRLNAQTLVEEAAAPFTGMPPLPAQIRMAVNRAAGRVYIIRPDHQAVAVYRADDLQPEPDLKPAGDLDGILADPIRPQTYVLCQHFTTGDTQSSVAVLRDGRVAAIWRTEVGYQTGQMLMDEAGKQLLLLEDAWSIQNRHSRLRALQPETGQTLSSARTPYLDFIYARSRFLYRNQIYRLSDNLASVRLTDGQLGQPIHLGIVLVNAALSESGDRLAALDSAGMVHLLDAATLTVLRSYPALGFRQDKLADVPMTHIGGRLYIADEANANTLVFEAETDKRLAALPRFGQVVQDTRRQRLYLLSQGVYLISANYQLNAAIAETVSAQAAGAPGAVAAFYDATHDWLLVKMSNNLPGSDRSDYLLAYEAATLRRAPVGIKLGQRFVTGMTTLANGQIWISGSFPGKELAAFDGQGRLLRRLPDLDGAIYASPTTNILYIAGKGELVMVDTAALTVSKRRALPEGATIYAADLARGRFYAGQLGAPHLVVIPADAGS